MTKHHQMPHQTHGRPFSRREMIGRGLIGSSALLLAPRLVFGAESAAVAPFLVFDMIGGGALAGNFLVGRDGGPDNLLRSYDTLGWNPRADNALDRSFGLPMAANVSGILQGLRNSASAEALSRLRMGSFCHFAQDDSSTNLTSAIALISKSGSTGTLLPSGLGTYNSRSGGYSDATARDGMMKPIYVASVDDATEAVTFGRAFAGMAPNTRSAMASAMRDLSVGQAGRYQDGEAERLAAIASATYGDAVNFANGFGGMDPRADDVFTSVYGLTPQSAGTDIAAIRGAVALNVLRAQTGPGVITFSGCDYHDGTQTTGDNKDLEVGTEIGRAVEAAHRLQVPMFFQLVTDGGIYAATGSRIWTGDAGIKGMTVIGAYHPNGPVEQRRLQVGNFTDGQGADLQTIVGSEPSKVAYAVLANYLNLLGRLGEFDTYAPGVFTASQLDSVLIFSSAS